MGSSPVNFEQLIDGRLRERLQIHVDCNLKINGTVHYRNVIVENDTFNISKENF